MRACDTGAFLAQRNSFEPDAIFLTLSMTRIEEDAAWVQADGWSWNKELKWKMEKSKVDDNSK